MQDVHFEGKKIIITKELRKVILDLVNENNYSDSSTEDINLSTPKKHFRKKYH